MQGVVARQTQTQSFQVALCVFRPSATKSGRPYGVMYMSSSWGTPLVGPLVWGGGQPSRGAQPRVGARPSADEAYLLREE